MPRGPREFYENAILNITSRGNNKRIIFRKEKDYRYFKKLLFKYKNIYKVKIYHYCLMRNHVHLLVKIHDKISISKAMHGLQLAYFNYYRRRYGYAGRFWQGRFYSKTVKNDKYLLTAGLYIENNPVRARLAERAQDYKWSSYNVYAYGQKNELINFDPYYIILAKTDKRRQSEYRKNMQNYKNYVNGK